MPIRDLRGWALVGTCLVWVTVAVSCTAEPAWPQSAIIALRGYTACPHSDAFSTNGKTPASGSPDEMIYLWDVSTPPEDAHLPLPEGALVRSQQGWINEVTFSADGRFLAIATSLGVELWDVATLEAVSFFDGSTRPVSDVAFSPDGGTLAIGSDDHTVRLWDTATGSLVRVLSGHTDWVNSVAFSPDGGTVASGSIDGQSGCGTPRQGGSCAP